MSDAVLTESEIFALIFEPGFSTAKQVSDVSGRGVGMDVVKREVDLLRGSIDVHSEPGRGTRVDLSLPLTLAIIEGLLVHVAEDSYVIPLSAVEECMELTPDRFATTSARNLIQAQGAPYPWCGCVKSSVCPVRARPWSRRSWSTSPASASVWQSTRSLATIRRSSNRSATCTEVPTAFPAPRSRGMAMLP